MKERRALVLRRESLSELSAAELTGVAGGATQLTFCGCPWSIVPCDNTRGINCTGACLTVEGC